MVCKLSLRAKKMWLIIAPDHVFFLSTLQRSGATSFKKEKELIELSEHFQKHIPYCALSHKQIQNFFW